MLVCTKQLLRILPAALLFTACVESGYDLSNDLDMTIGMGSNGLALKIGNTENIYLRDILEVDRDEDGMIDTTANGLYYLIKNGNTDFTVNVSEIATRDIDPVDLSPNIPLFTFDADATIPEFSEKEDIEADNTLEINVDNIDDDVVNLYSIVPTNQNISLSLDVLKPAGTNFYISEIKGFSIEFPDFVHSSMFREGTHTLYIGDLTNNRDHIELANLVIDSLTTENKAIENGTLNLADQITMNGNFTIKSTGPNYVTAGSQLSVQLKVQFPQLGVAQVSGQFNPAINPEVDPLEIGNDLPDFLQDPEVTLNMNNPTLRINMGGEELPIPLLFSGNLASVKDGMTLEQVNIPATNYVSVRPYRFSQYYFYDGTAPFDPNNTMSPEAINVKVPGLGKIVTKLPDQININLDGGRIKADPEARHTLRPGTDYHINLDYDVLMPFRYNANTCIVYNDSATDMNKDLKKYQADGITLTAKAINTVPLDLTVTLIPISVTGEDLSDVLIVEPAIAAAAPMGGMKETPLTITITARDRAAVSLLDQIIFKIHADAADQAELNSNQYIRMEDIRIRLNGQIIGNFN